MLLEVSFPVCGFVAGPSAGRAEPPELEAQYIAAGVFETGLSAELPADATCPPMTLHFGSRHNRSGRLRTGRHGLYHTGVDWALPVGTPILAIADGIVVARRSHLNRGPGHRVVIEHAGGTSSSYVHLSRFNVDLHQNVKKGQVIGFLGQSGTGATFAHLHLNVFGDERVEVGTRTWRYRYDYLQFLSGDMRPIDPVRKRRQKVKIAYMDQSGKVHPPEAKVIWPFVCPR